MSQEVYRSDVRTLVISMRNRNYGYPSIVKKVHEMFPEVRPFTEQDAQNIWARSRPRDTRTNTMKSAVPISLGGPKWSRPGGGE